MRELVKIGGFYPGGTFTRKKEVSIKKKEVSSEPSRMDQKAQRKAAFALSPSFIWSAIHSFTAGEYFYLINIVSLHHSIIKMNSFSVVDYTRHIPDYTKTRLQ